MSLRKFVLTNVAVRLGLNAAQIGTEAILAKVSPEKHAAYVDKVVEFLENQVDSFVLRNATIANYFSEGVEEEDVENTSSAVHFGNASPAFDALVERLQKAARGEDISGE